MNKDKNSPALISKNYTFTFNEYDQLISNAAENLQKYNLKKGDKLAILGKNCIEYPILILALFQIGAIAVPMSFRFPEEQINNLLDKIQCNNINLFNKQSKLPSFGRTPKRYLKDIVSCKDILSHKSFSPGKKINSRMTSSHPTKTFHDNYISAKNPTISQDSLSQDSLVYISEMFESNPNIIQNDHLATVIFTSGSSGEPKAALHTLENHFYSAIGSNQNIPFQSQDRWLLSLPLYHVGGLAILMRAFLGKGAVVIPDQDLNLLDNIKHFNPTHISLVATQLYRLLQDKKTMESLTKLKAILLGGSAIPIELIKQAVSYNLPIYTTYGSTEMASQITTTNIQDKIDVLPSSGKLLKHRQLKLMEDGEILVKGKTLFKGYIEKGKIKAGRDNYGWFHTGDLGKLDKHGYLTILGRKDNVFISGGENIQPEEIEKYLCQIKGIIQAVVVPIEDKEFGARPVAFIKTIDDRLIKPECILNNLKEKIARFKIPDHFFPFPASFPQNNIKMNRDYFKALATSFFWVRK